MTQPGPLNRTTTAKPFLKWVGGKGQLLQQLYAALPATLHDATFRYVEPFVGGGAMLFFMLRHFPNISTAVVNDINGKLTNAYAVVKTDPAGLTAELREVERAYFALSNETARKEFYLSVRSRYNTEPLPPTREAAFLIFLNRTCFNGLYRENSKGYFNVPFGRYKNPLICNEDLLYADSELLNRFDVKILTSDFTTIANELDSEGLNFIYFDPPYRPLNATSYFNSYVKSDFNDDKQRALATFCHSLSARPNCLWMLSNSDSSASNPSDTFFERLYAGCHIRRVTASRMVNANPSKRGPLTELLITNYADNLCISN